MHWLQQQNSSKPPMAPVLGTSLSAEESSRKSSSLPAYARHGFSFGLGRLRRKKTKSRERSASPSSSSSSSSEEQAPNTTACWERTKKESPKPATAPISFQTRVLVQETSYPTPITGGSLRPKSSPVDITMPAQTRRWKEERAGLSKKERREQLKARVEALRERLRDSSSDEDTPTGGSSSSSTSRSRLHKVSSDEALHRSRMTIAERIQSRRKSREEDRNGSKECIGQSSKSLPSVNSDSISANVTPTVPRRYVHASRADKPAVPHGRRNWSLDRCSTGNVRDSPRSDVQSHDAISNGCNGTERRPSSPYPCQAMSSTVKPVTRAPTPPPRSPKTLSTFSYSENGAQFLPPPPPVRHGAHHQRPVSYAFENHANAPYGHNYSSSAKSKENLTNGFHVSDHDKVSHTLVESHKPVSRITPTSAAYLSDSHVMSMHQTSSTDGRNFNMTPKPWNSRPTSVVEGHLTIASRPRRHVTATSSLESTRQATPPIPPRRCSVHLVSGNGNSPTNPRKSPNNLEDALQELEQIYQSLKLKDEELMDRAERREFLTSPLINNVVARCKTSSETNLDKKTSNSQPEQSAKTTCTFKPVDVANLNSLNRHNVTGSYDSLISDIYRRNRVPVPTDDLAYRRLQRSTPTRPPTVGSLIGTSSPATSYLLLSPALSPAVSSDDVTKTGRNHLMSSASPLRQRPAQQPDTVLDDVHFRSLRDANNQKVPESQPPFGIPVGVVSPASASDYLHMTNGNAQPKERPTFRPRNYPDLLQDDMAFRALRKEKSPPPRKYFNGNINVNGNMNGSNGNIQKYKDVNTEELDSLLRVECKPPIMGTLAGKRKYRAARSLSANITHLIRRPNHDIPFPPDPMERTQSMSDISQVLNSILNDSDDGTVPPPLNKLRAKNLSSSLLNGGGGNELSTSTETLTGLPTKADESSDIWQLRVTVQPSNVVTSQSPKPPPSPLTFAGGIGISSKLLTRPRSSSRADSASDSEMRGCARGVDPMDEQRLDSLLKSLASGASGSEDNDGVHSSQQCQQGRKLHHPKQAENNNGQQVVDTLLQTSSALHSSSTSTTSSIQLNKATSQSRSAVNRRASGDGKQDGSKEEGKASRPPASNTSAIKDTVKNGDSAEKKAERIAKYKEERRKQLASKYGDWSSSEDITNIGEEPSYMRFSRRHRNRGNASKEPASESSGVDGAEKQNGAVGKNGSVASEHSAERSARNNDGKENNLSPPSCLMDRVPDPGGTEFEKMVRTNRASRLRALATNSSLHENGEFVRTGSLRLRGSYSDADTSFLRTSPLRQSCNFSTHSSIISDANNGVVSKGLQQSLTSPTSSHAATNSSCHLDVNKEKPQLSPTQVKDKSGKRKSNLNRAMIVEAAPPPCQLANYDDSLTRHRKAKQKSENGEKKSQEFLSVEDRGNTPTVKSPSNGHLAKGESNQSDDTNILRKLKTSPLKRPEIPEILRHRTQSQQNQVEQNHVSVPHEQRNPESVKHIIPSAFKVRIEVKNENDDDAANRIRVLTDLVRETTAKVDNLTYAALNSDSDMGARAAKVASVETESTSKLATNETPSQNKDSSITTKEDVESDAENNMVTAIKVQPCHSKIFQPEVKSVERSFVEVKYRHPPMKNVVSADAPALPHVPIIETTNKEMKKRLQNKFRQSLEPEDEVMNLEKRVSLDEESESDDAYLTPAADVGNDCSPESFRFSETFSSNKTNDQGESLVIFIKGESVATAKQETKIVDVRPASILKRKSLEGSNEVGCFSLLGHSDDPPSILRRHSDDPPKSGFEVSRLREASSEQECRIHSLPVSILRKKSSSEESDGKSHSILKHKMTTFETEERESSPEPHSILKRRYSSDDQEVISLEPRPILKKKNSLEDLEPKPILKKKSSTEDELEERLKPILKSRRRSGSDDSNSSSSNSSSGGELVLVRRSLRGSCEEEHVDGDIKPILKTRSSLEEKPVSILKMPDFTSRPPSILKARSFDIEESFLSAVRLQTDGKNEEMTGSDSYESTAGDVGSVSQPQSSEGSNEMESNDMSLLNSEFPALLPSILKKRSSVSNVHPLATPHSEIANYLKAQKSPEADDDKKSFSIDIPNEGEDGPRLSVAERINQMEARLEEDKLKQCRSPWRSGQSTPCQRFRAGSTPPLRSGDCTPLQLDEFLQQIQEPISKDQLMMRLEDVAQNSRRMRYDRNSDRFRTQPITLEEVEDSNSLASVQKFRRLVLTKASFDAFKQREKDEQEPLLSPIDKPTEFPQPFFPVKSKEWSRHRRRTLPVTVEELADAEKTGQKSSEESSSGDDVLHLSVAAKASLFMRLEKSSTPVKKNMFRRGLQRSQTQPVTFEEFHEASKIADDSKKPEPKKLVPQQRDRIPLVKQNSVGMITKLMPQEIASDKTSSESEEDPCKLSLSERIKLFNRKIVEDRLPAQKSDLPKGGLNRKRNSSRYRTQPVTSEELEKALDMKAATNGGDGDSISARSVDDVRVPPIYEEHEELCCETIIDADEDESDFGTMQFQQQVKTQGEAVEFTQHIHIVNHPYDTSNIDISSSATVNRSEAVHITSETRTSVVLESEAGMNNGDELQSHFLKNDGLRLRGSKENPRIKNEAINRRRNAALRRCDERRSACELSSGSNSLSESSCPIRKMHSVHHRSSTAPLTKLEVEKAQEIENNRKSIADRVAALQQSGEGWKKRVSTSKEPPELNDDVLCSKDSTSSSSSDEKTSKDEPRSFIERRKSLLAESQEEWKQRVEDCDAVQFTVAGKMGCKDESLPVTERAKCKPTPSIFRSKTDLRDLQYAAESGLLNVPPGSTTIKRSRSMPSSPTKSVNNNNNNEAKEETQTSVRVVVPKADDESFQAFFSSSSTSTQKVEISEDVFKQVTSEKREMLIQKRTVRMQRRHVCSKNPLKALATRTDIQNEYVETKTGIAEKELKRVKVQQLAKNSPSLAISALAGLASKEDFTNVALKKTAPVTNTRLNPYKDLMLLQVKGRRHVQTRLVDPCILSINKGDNFILVTPKEVFNWIGEFSNVIERSRAAEVASIIQSRKDLGCSCSSVITIDNEKKTGMSYATKFYKHLGGKEEDVKEAGNPKEDETYENDIISTNMMYEVENDKLVPCTENWGDIPRIEMLDKKKVFVFDFGTEVYVWQGKLAPPELRKAGVSLARELWEKGYDYSECHINPVCPLLNDNVPKLGSQRPDWTLLAKLNQHMETILFQEKFLDWPDTSRVIKVKKQDSDEKIVPAVELVPCDGKTMLESPVPEPDLLLEGTHIGRGNEFWDDKERRRYIINTLGIKIWQVSEFEHHMLPCESWGQFYSGDTYVVRWQFRITVGGRDLSGQISRHSTTGRERCAYFFWQGKNSTINEKGASALMTVELDQERGPHVLVEQDHEPPCFVNLFGGFMVIHRGKREAEKNSGDESESSKDEDETEEEEDEVKEQKCEWKLFFVRGELELELSLVETRSSTAALRSRGCLLLVNISSGTIYVWHGSKAPDQINELAYTAAETIRSKRPREIGFNQYASIEIKEVNEGSEPSDFINGLGGGSLKSYHSLKDDKSKFDFTPRLFHMTSVSGSFKAVEVPYPLYSSSMVCPFPFMQSYLYKAAQPALFMLDNHKEVYLWQGWWPEATDDNENLATGSAKVRWNVDRRCAMMTAISYCQEKNKTSPPPAYLVSAGLEPLSFTNLFPEWEVMDELSALNAKDGKQAGERPLVQDVLAQLNRTRYTLEELKNSPEGVDPSRLECYLDDDDFQDVLGMDRQDFYSLPSWKQKNVKQTSGLY